MRNNQSSIELSPKQKESRKKCDDLAEWIRSHKIDGKFEIESGVICHDYTKCTEGFITTMNAHAITSTYCYVAYKNLKNIQAIAQKIGYKMPE